MIYLILIIVTILVAWGLCAIVEKMDEEIEIEYREH